MRTMEEIMAELNAQRAKSAEEADEGRLVLAAAMMSAGVERVHIHFSGYGDSGNVHAPEITMRPGFEEPADLGERLMDWADVFLEGTGVDWYNNDGGQGEIEFDLTTTPPRFSAYVDCNRIVSDRAFEVEEGA